MPFRADLFLLALLATTRSGWAQEAPPAEVVTASGPRGTSGDAKRYDAVGRAALAEAFASPIGAAHATLPIGSVAEVTALDSGRTILVPIVAQGQPEPGDVIALAPGAFDALGVSAKAGVRVRSVSPSPQDQAALQAGRPGLPRLDAPPVLLTGLRKQLAMTPAPPAAAPRAAAALPKPAPNPPGPKVPQPKAAPPKAAPPKAVPPKAASPAPASRPTAVAGSGVWFVQVAALSNETRAKALATTLGGRSIAAGRFWRVQLGPYPDSAAATAARARVARNGYPDATVFRSK